MDNKGNTKERIELLFILFSKMGEMLKELGEKENPQSPFLKDLSKNAVGIMNDMSKSLDAADFGKFMTVLIEFASKSNMLSNFMELDSEEKIEIGEYLINSAKKLKEIKDKIE